MENKINVAELLKNCPEGMELNCTLFSRPLKYSGLECPKDNYPIRTVAENGEIFWFTKEGCIHNNMYSKCVIFPKDKTSWEGFVPPCKFKDGDICYIKTNGSRHIFIFKGIDIQGYVRRYVNLTTKGLYRDNIGFVCHESIIEEFRYATKEEKDNLFKSIKDHGYMWNQEKKCLEKLPTFENGDIIVGKEGAGSYIAIVKEFTNSTSFTTHIFLTSFGTNIAGLNNSNPRLATEYEKQNLFKMLKANGRRWNPETKTLEKIIEPKFKVGDKIQYNGSSTYRPVYIIKSIEADRYIFTNGTYIKFGDEDKYILLKFDINTLKPFDQVLVRDSIKEKWHIQLFEKYIKTHQYPFKCMHSAYRQCIPYKGNELLLDTKDDCRYCYNTWE
jgi:hypothetical protein